MRRMGNMAKNKKSEELGKAMENAKRLLLPKTINLHTMTVIECGVDNIPDIRYLDGWNATIVREERTTRFVLHDEANRMTVEIKIEKTIPYL